MGVACVCRSRSDDESRQVSDANIPRWKARSGRGAGSFRVRGVRWWTCAKDTTLGELIRRWLDLVREDLSPSTIRGYERIVRCYIEPDIGRVLLAKLRTDQLDRFYSKLRDEGGLDGGPLSPATVRQTHAVIRRALNQAMRWGWISANPASLARPPRVRTRALHPPEADGVLHLIAEADLADPDLGCFCFSLLRPEPVAASSARFAGRIST